MALSYGASLPDSELLVNGHAEALIALLPTTAAFLAVRSQLEKEFAKKLLEASSKARLQQTKDAEARGSPPGSSNSLETAYVRLIEAADMDAREHLALASALQSQVIDVLLAAGTKLETIRKNHHAFANKLLTERDRAYEDRNKSKQTYFEACETLEAARQKKSQAKDERHEEKAGKAFDLAMDQMLVTKNQFLIDTNVANDHKARLYTTDLPAAHDDLQLLEATAITTLTTQLSKATTIQNKSIDTLRTHLESVESAVSKVNIDADQTLFADQHSRSKLASWQTPADLNFEESPVWHDVDEMSVIPPSTVYLQNVKLKALARISELSPVIESKQKEITGLRNLHESCQENPGLGDPTAALDNLLETLRSNNILLIQLTEAKAQVEVIDTALGDDGNTSFQLHEFKTSSFVTPAVCSACSGSIWGKGLSCKACSMAVHAKCELKVPGGCSRKPGAGLARKGSKPTTNISIKPTPNGDLGVPRRSVESSRPLPPPVRKALPLQPSRSSAEYSDLRPSAILIYDYVAASDAEINVVAGDVVKVEVPEDENGWTKVLKQDGRGGLVPNSYLEVTRSESKPNHKAPPPIPTRIQQRKVIALFDYHAQNTEELSITEGEQVALTATGTDFGNGWAEATKDGKVGIIPISYVQQM